MLGTSKRRVHFPLNICFHDDVQRGNLSSVKRLLSKLGADEACLLVNSFSNSGVTALHQACLDGRPDLVQLFLFCGADVDVFDVDGWQPLHAAAAMGNALIVSLLLEAGADPLCRTADDLLALDLADEERWEARGLLMRAVMVAEYPFSRTLVTSPSIDSGLATSADSCDDLLDDENLSLDSTSEDFFESEADEASSPRARGCPDASRPRPDLSVHQCYMTSDMTSNTTRSRKVDVVTLVRPVLVRPNIAFVHIGHADVVSTPSSCEDISKSHIPFGEEIFV